MAIKISGNTIIDDSRNILSANTVTATSFVGDGSGLTGIPAPDDVFKPTNTSPANSATNVDIATDLCGSPYLSLYGKDHACSCFQISECSDFSACIKFSCNIAGACTSVAVPGTCLAAETLHFFRVRYHDADGACSDFSNSTCFTTVPLPSILGESTFGGYYMGTTSSIDATNYYIIMAPNATGCEYCLWKTARTVSNGTEIQDGYESTYSHLNSAAHPAAHWTATRSISGFSDWYLPSKCEHYQLYINKDCAPAGEGFGNIYWTSTEDNFFSACILCMDNGNFNDRDKSTDGCFRLRAIRRVPF